MMTFVLLDHSHDLFHRLGATGGEAVPRMLFQQTELALYADQSPVLVAAGQPLLSAIQNAPECWPGLLIQSVADERVLLDHLRGILLVRFDGGQRKGVLRYWSPRTASYFFPAESKQRLRWFGPIHKISWHGGTWREKAESIETWKSLENPLAEHWLPPAERSPMCLDEGQEAALLRQQQEHFVYQWPGSSRMPFGEAWQYFCDGASSGFDDSEQLLRYLELREAFRGQRVPANLPGESADQRLAYLEESLQRGCMNKDEQA